jgi:hypothetical protein
MYVSFYTGGRLGRNGGTKEPQPESHNNHSTTPTPLPINIAAQHSFRTSISGRNPAMRGKPEGRSRQTTEPCRTVCRRWKGTDVEGFHFRFKPESQAGLSIECVDPAPSSSRFTIQEGRGFRVQDKAGDGGRNIPTVLRTWT